MAMNFSELQSVMEILREVCKLPHKNKMILFFIFLSTFIPYILLMIATITSISTDLSMNVFPLMSKDDPTSPDYFKQLFQVKKDVMLFILIEMVLILVLSVITLFSMMTTIYVSAMSYLGRDLKLKDLLKKIEQIWIRPVVTWFYITLMVTGVFVLVLPLIFLVILSKGFFIVVLMIGTVILFLDICLNMYLTLVWMLSIVTSVLEDSCGMQAIQKGADLLKGKKLVGFVLISILMIISGLNYVVASMMIKNIHAVTVKLLMMLCVMIFAILVKILSLVMYTLFYFDCKHSHGEEVEVGEDMGYTKVSKLALVDSALP